MYGTFPFAFSLISVFLRCFALLTAPADPVQKTIGKALKAMSVSDALAIASQTRQYMEYFGYMLASTPAENGSTDLQGSAAQALSLEVLPLSALLNTPAQKQALGTILVNSEEPVRPMDDKFGRKITDLRKSLTVGDTKPFPVS